MDELLKKLYEDLLKKLYKDSIKKIKEIEEASILYNMLDKQEYLDWKDELNRLSIDQDRKDTSHK